MKKIRSVSSGLGFTWESKGSLDYGRDQLDESPLEPEKNCTVKCQAYETAKNICCGFCFPVNCVEGINTQDVCLLLCGTAP